MKGNRERIKADKEPASDLEACHRQYQSWQLAPAKSIHEIHSEHSLREALRQVKKVIWDSM